MRIEKSMPGPYRVFIHLKDSGLVKAKKVGTLTFID
jgi:hypothetical protein